MNLETRSTWAFTSPLCQNPWGGCGVKGVIQGPHSFGGKTERRTLPSLPCTSLDSSERLLRAWAVGFQGTPSLHLDPGFEEGALCCRGGGRLDQSAPSPDTVEPNLCSPPFQAPGLLTAKGRSSFSGATPH